ncbi:MAG: hypothetical protein AAB649_02410 [Patescibacteria group bacterium]
MNKFITSTILGAMVLGLAMPAFAEETTRTEVKKTVAAKIKEYMPKKADLTCMRNAVGAREDSIISAKEKAFASMDATFKARRDALKSAWEKTDAKERRSAINAAWKAFKESHKTARKQLQADDRSAWSAFKTASKACNVDSSSEGSDRAGEKLDRDTL